MRIAGIGPALNRIAAVAGNTLREAGRNRIFYGAAAVAVLMLLFSLVLSDLALLDQKARLVQDFGLFVIPLLCIVTAVILGVVLLQKEIEKKTLYAILPKPIRRSEFLLGKFVGLCTLLLIQLLLLAVCWVGVLAMRGGELTNTLVMAMALSYVEIVLVTAIATFFSALSSPVLSGVMTLGLFACGRVSYVITDLMTATKGVFVEVDFMRWLGAALVAVVPDLSTFNVADEILLGWEIGADYMLNAVTYGLSYAAVFLLLGLIVFERRDLT
jgi:Cu-processing system permease protein